jgi:mannose-1-phosphate guanylyltransferase
MGNKEPLVLILCGGRSLRLWPVCEYKSKNFLDIFGFSPLEFTINRFLKITSRDNIFLIANCNEKETIKKFKLLKNENIFWEPESKNTAAAIILALFYLQNKFAEDRVLIISPVDHLIKQEAQFYCALKEAVDVSRAGSICTLGIQPTQPTPNFGYIQVDREINGSFAIKKFVEKPTRVEAEELIRRGNAYYNSGLFISLISLLDKEYKKYYPFYGDFVNTFKKSGRLLDKAITSLYKKLEDTPFDKAIMEKTTRGRLVKAKFFWRDFGSWLAVYEALPKDEKGNVKRGKVFAHNSGNNFIYLDDKSKKVLLLGLKDIFYIDTGKYILLTHRHYLDNLKTALKEFKSETA